MNQNILFTCAGRRNYLINYFKDALEGKGNIYAADKNVYAPALVHADIAIEMPDINAPEYIETLIKVIKQNNITAVISLNDLELPLLAKNKSEIERTGAKVIISNEDVINIAFDKWKTHQFLLKIGLNSPKSYISLDSAISAIQLKELTFPLVLKPRWGSGSIGINYADDLEELKLVYKLTKLQIVKDHKNDDLDHGIIIQEKLEGIEYGLDILNDFNGNYVGTFGREKLNMRSGETDIARSVVDEELDSIGSQLGINFKHIGNLDCDVFKYQNKFYVLELNPRFGGGYPFSHEAGINTAAIYIDWLNGIKNIDAHNNYKDGLIFSKCDRLIRIIRK